MRTNNPPWPGLRGRFLAQRTQTRMMAAILIGGIGCLVAMGAVLAVGVPWTFPVLCLGLPGVGFTAAGGFLLLRAGRFSDVKLDVGPVPLNLGGLSNLQLLFPKGIAATKLDAKLECRKLTTVLSKHGPSSTGSGSSTSIGQSTHVIFEQKKTVSVRPHPKGAQTRVDLGFAVTGELPLADNALAEKMLKKKVGASYIEWIVEVTADIPGTDLSVTFALPLHSR